MAKTIIGVMGPGDNAKPKDLEAAFELGERIALKGWILLTGGRNVGVMNAASRGAVQAGGLTIGILPSESNTGTSEFVDIPIYTGMGSARNNINVLTSEVVIACGLGPGTASEITLALKSDTPVILINPDSSAKVFFQDLNSPNLYIAVTPAEAVEITERLI